jgi:hypothetical protein
MNDLQLRKDVLDELEFEPSVNAALIGVAVERGAVTLTGHVSTYPEKLAAVKAVRRVKGVRAIADEIERQFPTMRSQGVQWTLWAGTPCCQVAQSRSPSARVE